MKFVLIYFFIANPKEEIKEAKQRKIEKQSKEEREGIINDEK